ncbi:lytic transglycosylase domain-containing protein [Sphingomonas sp. KRR8]|uniref:lytic transglycosylase domain-containing protein n=1 Tax=Sphingomonas sp. KRR8 TaxID=2942996 RepID=UPI0020220AE6|nr:lytic transglycosylase domain-containing protein [Sphingomonas sp. KRR8]URD62122.1 lytic transglycosylase domain-containing protein [Sphingomonas sp. KRR8]
MSSMRRMGLALTGMLASAAIAGSSQLLVPVQQAPVVSPAAYSYAGDVNGAISDWRRLRQSSGYAFADYARFLLANPGWPGETTMRRAAEKQMRPGEDAATVVAFFRTDKPTTGNGWARLAESLAAQGRSAEALSAAREAWAGSDLGSTDEMSLYQRFGSQFTAADMDRRIDRLLLEKDATNAQRLLVSASAARRPAFAARVAMLQRSPDTELLYNQVMGQVTSDAGLMQDRARYLRDAGWDPAFRQLLARPHQFTTRPVDAEKWYELLLSAAQGAARDRQFTTAYNIARQVDDALPAGAQLALQAYGVRDDYTSLTWLAGVSALRGMNRPADAVPMFDRYSQGGRSLQVVSKGAYWAGRAAAQAGQYAQATSYFSRAAAYPELFYGQLALERLGRQVPVPATSLAYPTPLQRQAFQSRRLVRALQALDAGGYRQEAALFVRAISESVHSDSDRQLAIELGNQIGRPDLAVWTVRSARNDGSAFYNRLGYPTVSHAIADPSLWSLAHGIARQESSFDRSAVSGAGARGLMQLMPGTAAEQAGKLGYGYDGGRLTSDPAYNVMLGSAYFRRLVDRWGGNYPLAIASYNAGSGNVAKWIANNGDPRRPGGDIVAWIEDIPFTETRGYVQRVLENTVVYDRLNPQPANQPRYLSYFLGKDRLG